MVIVLVVMHHSSVYLILMVLLSFALLNSYFLLGGCDCVGGGDGWMDETIWCATAKDLQLLCRTFLRVTIGADDTSCYLCKEA